MKYIVISKECLGCGEDIAVQIFDHLPTEDDIQQVHKAIGGASCVTNYIGKLNPEEPIIIKREEL